MMFIQQKSNKNLFGVSVVQYFLHFIINLDQYDTLIWHRYIGFIVLSAMYLYLVNKKLESFINTSSLKEDKLSHEFLILLPCPIDNNKVCYHISLTKYGVIIHFIPLILFAWGFLSFPYQQQPTDYSFSRCRRMQDEWRYTKKLSVCMTYQNQTRIIKFARFHLWSIIIPFLYLLGRS